VQKLIDATLDVAPEVIAAAKEAPRRAFVGGGMIFSENRFPLFGIMP
jgi:hypothetical protein